jgi:hypothetical protein
LALFRSSVKVASRMTDPWDEISDLIVHHNVHPAQ